MIKAQTDLINQMQQNGEDGGNAVVQGLIQGIVNSTPQLVAAMKATIQAAIDAAMAALNAASPSKVFMEIGTFMTDGMAIGAQSKAMQLADATAGVAMGAIHSASSTVSNWNLTANYKHQGEQSLCDDIVMLSMLRGRK